MSHQKLTVSNIYVNKQVLMLLSIKTVILFGQKDAITGMQKTFNYYLEKD